MFAGESVGGEEERGGVCLGAGGFGGEFDGDAFEEVDGYVFGFVGGGEDGVFGELPHSGTLLVAEAGRRNTFGLTQLEE